MVRRGLREAEDASLEPLVPERVAIAVPVEDLEAIAAPISKDEEMAAEGIQADGRGGEGSEAVESLPEIRWPNGQENADGGWEVDDGRFSRTSRS